MKPTVGRIVHYCADQWEESNDTRIFAAMIVKVNDDGSVNLRVFPNSEQVPWFKHHIWRAPAYQPGRWSWPPMEDS